VRITWFCNYIVHYYVYSISTVLDSKPANSCAFIEGLQWYGIWHKIRGMIEAEALKKQTI